MGLVDSKASQDLGKLLGVGQQSVTVIILGVENHIVIDICAGDREQTVVRIDHGIKMASQRGRDDEKELLVPMRQPGSVMTPSVILEEVAPNIAIEEKVIARIEGVHKHINREHLTQCDNT
jgi:hypothetical protein